MILYFNKNGQLLEQLEYGAVARVGMTRFQIFAYFEDIDLSNYDSALIRFKRPDLNSSEYPDLFMVQASINYDENIEDSDYFEAADNPYVGFLFDFNTITDGSGNVVLLDTPGQWEASITLVSTNGGFNVTGLVRFTVEGSVSEADDEETELQYSTISNNIALAVAQKVGKSDENYIRYNANLGTNAAQGNLLAVFYPVGCLAYDGTTNAIYKIDTVTPKDETHVYATISKVWQIDNPAEVDGALSSTSTNPVENQVVANALQNVREVAEGKCKSVVISYDATEPSVNDYEEYYRDDGTTFASAQDMTTYLNQNNFANSSFNTQDDSVDLRGYYIVDIYNRIYVFKFTSDDYASLKIGDIIYVIELDVPDRWVSESAPYEAEAMVLETKSDLTGFVKTDATSQTISGQKTFNGILKCTSKFNLVGRFNHDLIPDGAEAYSVGSQTEPLANVFTKSLGDGTNSISVADIVSIAETGLGSDISITISGATTITSLTSGKFYHFRFNYGNNAIVDFGTIYLDASLGNPSVHLTSSLAILWVYNASSYTVMLDLQCTGTNTWVARVCVPNSVGGTLSSFSYDTLNGTLIANLVG